MARIVIFDSGVGGIAISQAIRQQLPDDELHIVMDNDFFPYGEKTASELQERVLKVLHNVVSSIQPDVIVIACNTASTLVLEPLRACYQIPIVGVVPAVKPAAELSRSHVIGVIATPATIDREYTQDLIAQFAQHCELIMSGSTELVYLAEDWAYNGSLDTSILVEILEPFAVARDQKDMDTLVLACTHFPLLKEPIQQALAGVNVVDSSAAIARQVARVLAAMDTAKKDVAGAYLWHTGTIKREIKDGSLISQYQLKELDVNDYQS